MPQTWQEQIAKQNAFFIFLVFSCINKVITRTLSILFAVKNSSWLIFHENDKICKSKNCMYLQKFSVGVFPSEYDSYSEGQICPSEFVHQSLSVRVCPSEFVRQRASRPAAKPLQKYFSFRPGLILTFVLVKLLRKKIFLSHLSS